MITLSDSLPIQFWKYADPTYNETQFAFADKIPFYQEFQMDDVIKLQLRDDVADNEYSLVLVDVNGNLLDVLTFNHVGTYHQLSFQSQALDIPIVDMCARAYIVSGDGTFDSTFDSTFNIDALNPLYKSDYITFSSSVRFDSSWGSKLIGYKSKKNFAGISYPNDDTYFFLRIPCQFFRQRPKGSQDSIPSGGNTLLNTSIVKGKQQLMKTIYMPDYMHNKLELVFQHAASGSILIDGVFWTMEEGYELTIPDEKSPFQMGKVWLSDSNYLIRNMI